MLKMFFLCYVIFVDIIGLCFIIDNIRKLFGLIRRRMRMRNLRIPGE